MVINAASNTTLWPLADWQTNNIAKRLTLYRLYPFMLYESPLPSTKARNESRFGPGTSVASRSTGDARFT